MVLLQGSAFPYLLSLPDWMQQGRLLISTREMKVLLRMAGEHFVIPVAPAGTLAAHWQHVRAVIRISSRGVDWFCENLMDSALLTGFGNGYRIFS
jgi:hypothetical protein